MATPDYSKIWGANSPLAKYEFTEADYLRGWEFIGSMPPGRTMFDAWMRGADEKMRWLYNNAFSENSLGGFLSWRLPDTAYFVGEKRALQDGPLDVYLECTIAGRTSKEQMKKLPQGAEIGKTFVDGTATWLVRQFATNAALDDHRTKTPLDHPDGSVLKRHLGFEVYTKDETDACLNAKANANHGYHVPAPEAANNTRFLRNDNTWQTVTAGNIGAYTKGETYTKSEIDYRVNGKVSKSGDTMSGRLTLPSILANDWFRALGDCGFYFESHGGGWHMTDNDWIRAYNGKNIYTSGVMRCDAGFEGSLRGTADNANKLGDKSLQWVLEQIKNSIVKIAILTGTVAHGGTIPLPDGYTESQCRWMVSVASDNPGSDRWDINESGNHMHYRFECWADKRTVHCLSYHGCGGSQIYPVAGTANYMVIGVK